MRLEDNWLDAVFFLAVERPDPDTGRRLVYAGTGFYVRMQNEWNPQLHRLYFVTARHCIEQSRLEGGALYLRLNTDDGAAHPAPISKWSWTFHADDSVDVAVLAPTFARSGAKALLHADIEPEVFADSRLITDRDIGVGSDISTVGLFRPRSGVGRNIPIVRSGIIAAMPGEPIDDGVGGAPSRAYLVELLSMAGLSGSLVLVHPLAGPRHVHKSVRISSEQVRVSTEWIQETFVLGLVRSHWDERPTGPLAGLPQPEWINRGIAAVTPISHVLENLNYSKFRSQRRRDAARARKPE